MKLWFIVFLKLFFGSTATAAAPKSIVSLSLASDEILLEILPQCNALASLKAVSTLADDPESSNIVTQAKAIPFRVHSEPEAVLRHKPDMVIAASFNRPELLDLLKRKKTPLLILDQFSSHRDIAKNIRSIGRAVGCEKPAENLAVNFERRIAAIAQKNANHPLQTVVSWSAEQVVMAKDTLFDDLVSINHLENSATKAGLRHWPRVSPEALKKWNPYWIVLSCEAAACTTIRKQIQNHAIWSNLDAVKKQRFFEVPPRILLSTSQYFGVELKRSTP